MFAWLSLLKLEGGFVFRTFACLILCCSTLAAQEVTPVPIPAVTPVVTVTGIVFPMIPVAETVPVKPVAPADPDAVPVLKYGQFYVVQSEVEFFLLASPAKLVDISRTPGPITLRGHFADGVGRVETRTFKGKFIAFVDALENVSGRVELIGVPAGVKDEAEITRTLIEIGVAPRPPPDPIPVPPVPVTISERVTAALTGPTAKSDAIALVAAAEKVVAAIETYKTAAELQQHWFALLAANKWVKGSRPTITAILEEAIPQEPVGTTSPPLTVAERTRIASVFTSIRDGAKEVLK